MKLTLKSKIINIIGTFKYKQILQCFVKYGRKKPHIFGKSFCRHDLQKVVLVFDKVFFFHEKRCFFFKLHNFVL
jgi:hypothetical protein